METTPKSLAASPALESYFQEIQQKVENSYQLAAAARKKGLDPEEEVPIPLAKNMAERVVGLISVVAPQIATAAIPQRIIELEQEYGFLDWRVGLKIAEEVATGCFCAFATKEEAMEVGIRTGFAYLTLGIVSAPLEGFIGLKIKKRRDGGSYFALQYAGPIRAAGGTGQCISVIIADYVRLKMGYATYDPDQTEISRYIIEIQDYHERVTNLQYRPSEEELRFLLSHLPVEIDGEPTEQIAVSNYKDLPRIETNSIRGGMALVLAEGLSQKAPKVWKNVAKWGSTFGLDWSWLKEFLALKEKVHAKDATKDEKESEKKKVLPNTTYLMDLVAGRPILTHPLAAGGFRLRYGRSRTCGMYAIGVHPATMAVLDKYIAIGTQLKVERPRKSASVTVCETIDGPLVRLKNGSVLFLKNEQESRPILNEIESILFLGDMLVNYGDFADSGHSLVPAGYCPEWWALEVEKALGSPLSVAAFSEKARQLSIPEDLFHRFLEQPLTFFPSWPEALRISQLLHLPLHPQYTFYWRLISGPELLQLRSFVQSGKVKKENGIVQKIILCYDEGLAEHRQAKQLLESVGIPHQMITRETLLLQNEEAEALAFCLSLGQINSSDEEEKLRSVAAGKDGLEMISLFCPLPLRDKAGTFIGARMGRPEKAKMRQLTGSPQCMFPIGEEGDRLRSFQAALKAGKVRSTFPSYFCAACKKEMIYHRCEECGEPCQKWYQCRICGRVEKEACPHGIAKPYKNMELPIQYYFSKALERLGERVYPDLIKGIRGTSNKNHVVEHLAKGILRAKHGVYVNKDGTTRYDCTELPITHFKPKEVGTSVEKLRDLGYIQDIFGTELSAENQILELRPQDVILPGFNSLDESASQVLTRVAAFIDDLLVRFYKLPPFYSLKKPQDLVGHLVVGLAPHISVGIVGRIIGFSETQGLFAHPMFHAGMRRDCDGDEACVMLIMDALLNFSRQYLPEKRGAKTMDAALVLTSILNPAEVDDQVLQMDVAWRYPLELYEAALDLKSPSEVKSNGRKVEQLADRLGKPEQYEHWGFTHSVDNINRGIQCSAYKTLPSMGEKLFGQMELARKIRAVNLDDVAKLVIQKHFLRDIKGNLRKFSTQQFRCAKCNTKYRRPPLWGKCLNCNGNLLFTITEGSVVKYLGFSLALAEKYDFSPYLKQTLHLLQLNIEKIFGREKEKQVGLGTFL